MWKKVVFFIFPILLTLCGSFFFVANASSETLTVTIVSPQCSDGIDNDGDTFIDYPDDPDCTSATDNLEAAPQCSDGIDNDGDSLIDYPADNGCTSASDDDETSPPPDPTPTPTPSGGGGGGGGGYSALIPTEVVFTGIAEVYNRVIILKDGALAVVTTAQQNKTFRASIKDLSPGTYQFTLYAEDGLGNRSKPLSLSVYIKANVITSVSGIVLGLTESTQNVGEVDSANGVRLCRMGDVNCDNRVDIVDFSVAAFWFEKPLSEEMALIEKTYLNGDGVIDIVDFSIMAYWWTG